MTGRLQRSIHLLTLWGFAVAQPLFDLIGRNPAFLTAHQLDRFAVVLLALGVAVVLPVVLALAVMAVGMLNRRAEQHIHIVMIGAFCALLVMQGLFRASVWPELMLISVAVIAACLSMWAYHRYGGVRTFVSLLSPTILLFPALFLFTSPATRLLQDAVTTQPRGATQQQLPHIVFLVFDELPTTVLMNPGGEIERANFPAFHALAESAYWFRNATTVHTRTEHAVPALLTGVMPDPGPPRIPSASEFPDNLFTWAGSHYRVVASEPLTDLCPVRLCPVDVGMGPPQDRMQRMFRDLTIIYLHLVLPPSARTELPPINRSWANFGKVQFDLHDNVVALNTGGRHQQVARFIGAIDGSPMNTLYFMHTNLPHLPYEYLPGGERYFMHTRIRGLKPGVELDTWLSDATALNDAYTRFVAQARYVDKIVGDVILRLKERGVYDDVLLIVTADHGVSIRTGDLRRGVTEANQRDIAGVPLFIKLPNQTSGQIVDRNVEITDIVPSVSAALGLPLPWTPDGTSVFASGETERKHKTLIDGHKVWELPADLMLRPGQAADSAPVPLINHGLVRALLGRSVGEFEIRAAIGMKAVLRRAELFENVDFDQFLPAHVVGDLRANQVDLSEAIIAIAVNDRIQALTRVYASGENDYGFSQLLPASAFRPGANRVAVYRVLAPRVASEGLVELMRID